MQCPNVDGELAAHTTHGENNLTVSYSTCATCQGYWMDSFAANFIKLSPKEEHVEKTSLSKSFSCPVCTKKLERSVGANIPDAVFVFACPDHHGYFFPTGQLAAFKKAQKAKIAYHQLWHIPLPSVASVLLGVLLVAISAAGLFSVVTRLNEPQTTTSQAEELLLSHQAYVSEVQNVLFSATTTKKATVVIHIPSLSSFEGTMDSTDQQEHILIVKNIPAGTYEYYFTIIAGEATSNSKRFTFTMP